MEEQGKNSGNETTKPDNSPVPCGPGCSCGATARKDRLPRIVSFVVLAAVAGILVYKVAGAKQADSMVAGESGYESAVDFGSSSGGNLGAVNDLNRYAMNQDAVFIYVPDKGGRNISKASKEAVLSANKVLAGKGTKVGFFTLKTSSPDFKAISSQITVPAVLVVSKGKGMAVVSGEATVNKILQAFVESSRASSCGPGGAASCAPGAPGCK